MRTKKWWRRSYQWMPGFAELVHYPTKYWQQDLAAGLSVAAVALPVSFAYAQLAGFNPIVGLYSSIFPLFIYALFGSSRQMIMGPDAATCAVIAATLLPLSSGDPDHYAGLAVTLTLLAGLFCVLASRFRLGFLAEFLSRPILTGLLNGVAISIIFKQLDEITGIAVKGSSFVSQVVFWFDHIDELRWPVLFFSAGLLGIYSFTRYYFPRLPAALVILVTAIILAFVFNLPNNLGISVIGAIEGGLPHFRTPEISSDSFGSLFSGAVAVALISYTSSMLTARSFATKTNDRIDGNREFLALGLADIAAALCQGFAISGADSRTAVSISAGGKTRMVSVIAGLTLLIILLFLIEPMAWIPLSALGVILIVASFNLLDFKTIWRLRKINRVEFAISVITLLGVLIVGVMPGILLAVALSLFYFLSRVARPLDAQLGLIEGLEGFYELSDYKEARPLEGLIFYRFDSPLTFFNADYFRSRITRLIQKAACPVRWVIIDSIGMGDIDVTGVLTLLELGESLEKQGIVLALTGRTRQKIRFLERWAPREAIKIRFFPTRRGALYAFLQENPEVISEKLGQGN